jgi:hypothetical protein
VSRRLLIALLVFGALGLGAAGYGVGAVTAPTDSDAARERQDAERSAFTSSSRRAHAAARREGLRAGRQLGMRRGRKLGRRRGLKAGQQVAERRRAEQAQAAEAQRQQEIDQRANERAENCNAPLFVEGYCPSDEEVETENQAESLCGPGTEEGRRQAAEQGIDC